MQDYDLWGTAVRARERWMALQNSPFAPKILKDITPGSTPHEVIFTRGNLRLLKYLAGSRDVGEPRAQYPLVILPSMINRHYVMDLLPGNSLVEAMLKSGLDVYMIEWLPPTGADELLSPDDLFRYRIARALDHVLKDSRSEGLHLLGQCLGGTLAVIETLLRPGRVRSLTLLTTPVDFEAGGQLGQWTQTPLFAVDDFTEAYGNIPFSLMHRAFRFLRPSNMTAKWRRLAARWSDENFRAAFMALEMWSMDNISFPGKCYRFFIEDLYRRNRLSQGTLVIEQKLMALSAMRTPVLEVVAVDDHIVPNSMRWPERIPIPNLTRMELSGGHIGAVLGRRAQKVFWPELTRWLYQHDAKD